MSIAAVGQNGSAGTMTQSRAVPFGENDENGFDQKLETQRSRATASKQTKIILLKQLPDSMWRLIARQKRKTSNTSRNTEPLE